MKELIHGGFFTKFSSWIRDGLLVSKKIGDEPPSDLMADIPKQYYALYTPFEIPAATFARSVVLELPTTFFGRGNTV